MERAFIEYPSAKVFQGQAPFKLLCVYTGHTFLVGLLSVYR